MASLMDDEIQDETDNFTDAMTDLPTSETIKIIEDLDADPREKEELSNELKKPKTLCIMACGLTGAGKSTLLNGISGKKAFKHGHLRHKTTEVQKKIIKKGNYKLILCDTPGFEDESGNEKDYLKKIKEECTNVDTLFYCISVNVTRIKMKDDLATLNKLHEALDKRVWNSCVIVLTFANTLLEQVKTVKKGHSKIKSEYNSRIKEWEEEVQETFRRAGIDPTKMPIVHAGHATIPFLFSTDKSPWLTTFWGKVSAASNSEGRAVLFGFNIERFVPPDAFSKDNEDRELQDQQLVIHKSSLLEHLRKKFPTIAAALVTGGVTGVTGAGLGVTIGGLIIGASTFGVGTGLGMLVGGLIGGGIGVGIASATVVIDTVTN